MNKGGFYAPLYFILITKSLRSADKCLKQYSFKKFSFENEQECHLKINGSEPIFLKEGYGFDVGYDDPPIRSLVIVESGVEYQWFATM